MIIAMRGKAGSGKDTFALMMEELNPGVVCRLSFARAVKDCSSSLFGWDGEKDERGRRLLQRFGTECARHFDGEIWVRLLEEGVSDRSRSLALDYLAEMKALIILSVSSFEDTTAIPKKIIDLAARMAMAIYLQKETRDDIEASRPQRDMISHEVISYHGSLRRAALKIEALVQTMKEDDVRLMTGRINQSTVRELARAGHVVCLTDARFPNELDVASKRGGMIVKIERSESGRKDRLTDEASRHLSENALADNDYTHLIHNDSGLDELRDKARSLIESLRKRPASGTTSVTRSRALSSDQPSSEYYDQTKDEDSTATPSEG